MNRNAEFQFDGRTILSTVTSDPSVIADWLWKTVRRPIRYGVDDELLPVIGYDIHWGWRRPTVLTLSQPDYDDIRHRSLSILLQLMDREKLRGRFSPAAAVFLNDHIMAGSSRANASGYDSLARVDDLGGCQWGWLEDTLGVSLGGMGTRVVNVTERVPRVITANRIPWFPPPGLRQAYILQMESIRPNIPMPSEVIYDWSPFDLNRQQWECVTINAFMAYELGHILGSEGHDRLGGIGSGNEGRSGPEGREEMWNSQNRSRERLRNLMECKERNPGYDFPCVGMWRFHQERQNRPHHDLCWCRNYPHRMF